MLENMECEVKRILHNLKGTWDRKKVYVDQKRTYQEFEVGDHVYVRIKLRKITLRWITFEK